MNGERTKGPQPIPGAMNRIVALDTGYPSYGYEEELFRTHGFQFDCCSTPEGDWEAKTGCARDAVGILVRGTVIGAAELDRMAQLRAIVRYGTGYENIDLKETASRGIRVANVQGYASEAVSDHAMGLMFASVRGIGTRWPDAFGKPVRAEMFELHDKTLGIIGIGRIGSAFCRKAAPLFREVLAYDPYKSREHMEKAGASPAGWEELLHKSHVISIHCNLTAETTHLLDGRAFRLMDKRPVLINTARGAVINTAALQEALRAEMIHSAGLDVFETEPPGAAELLLTGHPRVTATPHVAWYSDRAQAELQRRAADNLLALLQGKAVSDEIIGLHP